MRHLRVDPTSCLPADLAPATTWLGRDGIVAFPTETFYGLAVDPRSEAAVAALVDLKGRALEAAFPLVAASMAEAEAWCSMGPLTRRLAAEFWPGPLTLIAVPTVALATRVASADGTVAVRVPGHAVARALAAAWGGLLIATSANRSGNPPSQRTEDLGDLADDPRVFVIDGGETAGGAPSTIIDARDHVPRLVREGAVAWSRVLESIHR